VATSDISTPLSKAMDPKYENKTMPAKMLVKLEYIFKSIQSNESRSDKEYGF